jgi:hypothetical protein
MDENDCNFLLLSQRELSSLELSVQSANSKAEVRDVLEGHEVPEEALAMGFPSLAKLVQEFPDESSPAP